MRDRDQLILEQAYATILEGSKPCPCIKKDGKCTKKNCKCPKCKSRKKQQLKENLMASAEELNSLDSGESSDHKLDPHDPDFAEKLAKAIAGLLQGSEEELSAEPTEPSESSPEE